MKRKDDDKQAWSIFRQRFPGLSPKKGQIKEIKRELRNKSKKQTAHTKHIITNIMSVRDIAKAHVNSNDPSYTPGDPFGYGKKKYHSPDEKAEAQKAMSKYYRQYSVGPVVGAVGGSGGKLPSNYRVLNAPPEKQIFIGGVGLVPASKAREYSGGRQSILDRRASKLFNERFPGQQPKKGQIKEIMKEILESKDN